MVDISWGSLLDPTNSLLNSVARGSIVYLALFAVLRMMTTAAPAAWASRTCCWSR